MRLRGPIGAAAVLALAGASIAGAWVAYLQGRDGARAAEQARLERAVADVEGRVEGALTAMRAARATVEAGGADLPERFRQMADTTLRGGLISTLTWAPRVTAGERAAFERRIGGPVTHVSFGGLSAAPPGRVHFPVEVVAPASRSESLGFDNASFPALAGALTAAARTGQPVATPPVPADMRLSRLQVVIWMPVMLSSELRGFVGGSIWLDRVGTITAQDVALFDGDQPLVAPAGRPDGPSATVGVAGRDWTVVAEPVRTGLAFPLTILGGGLALAALLGLLVAQGARRERYALALVARRIDERRQVEERLRAERDQQRALVGALQDGLMVFDRDGVLAEVNERMCAMTGLPAGELVGLAPPFPFCDPHDHALADALRAGWDAGSLEADGEIVRHDGTRLHVIMSVATLRSPSGEPEGAIVTVKDITERKRAERELEELASTDHLTGLPNHRAFHERLGGEVARARRHGRSLALVMLDLDHFKQVNDRAGHQRGDEVLAEAAARLAAQARAGETVARVGGEEFAWIVPECEGLEAFAAAERGRRAVASTPMAGEWVTLSAGVCDLGQAQTAAELYRLADAALYWAKAHGRNRSVLYTADAAEVLAEEAQEERLARVQAKSTILALARAVDARDPSTRRHSERVAHVCVVLATTLGWPAERVELLREVALVHDVGKIGVPDAVLLKPGALTEDERAEIRPHAALGATMVAGALTDEQALWIRHHHEREDGHGYPDGLVGDAIPQGARILAMADAWDAMIADRSYRPALGAEEAFAEARRCSGTQFWPEAVDALALAWRAGLLLPAPAGEGAGTR